MTTKDSYIITIPSGQTEFYDVIQESVIESFAKYCNAGARHYTLGMALKQAMADCMDSLIHRRKENAQLNEEWGELMQKQIKEIEQFIETNVFPQMRKAQNFEDN